MAQTQVNVPELPASAKPDENVDAPVAPKAPEGTSTPPDIPIPTTPTAASSQLVPVVQDPAANSMSTRILSTEEGPIPPSGTSPESHPGSQQVPNESQQGSIKPVSGTGESGLENKVESTPTENLPHSEMPTAVKGTVDGTPTATEKLDDTPTQTDKVDGTPTEIDKVDSMPTEHLRLSEKPVEGGGESGSDLAKAKAAAASKTKGKSTKLSGSEKDTVEDDEEDVDIEDNEEVVVKNEARWKLEQETQEAIQKFLDNPCPANRLDTKQ
ncbi:hypothetical protein PM082_015505 [Marasmius tenuissimus]|nr:hypothetical protein PM082_015505 [Marasmius tenuissimus]